MLDHTHVHPLRELVSAEIHARPIPSINQNVSIIYLAFMKPSDAAGDSRDYLAKFLEQRDAPPLVGHEPCYYQTFEGAQLRWESHQEFCSCLLMIPQDSEALFPDIELPEWWCCLTRHMPGLLINAVRLEYRQQTTPEHPLQSLPALMADEWVMGSTITDGAASVWTSYQQDQDGLTRFVVFDQSLSPFQVGRTCQRLLEADTYRTVALLGFPLARKIWPEIRQIDLALSEHTAHLSAPSALSGDQTLLDEISALSARTEQLRADSAYRFSASRAYTEIALRRLSDLREVRWPGTSSLAKFTERRFLPAMKTCEDAQLHLEELSDRIAQATALLRTRVELKQEAQNQKLLDAINKRGEMQLRMQSLVEGLSVIAITYYLAGLAKLVLDGQVFFPLWLTGSAARMLAVVALASIVFFYVRRRKNRIVGAA